MKTELQQAIGWRGRFFLLFIYSWFDFERRLYEIGFMGLIAVVLILYLKYNHLLTEGYFICKRHRCANGF